MKIFNLINGEYMKSLKSHEGEILKIMVFKTKEMAFIVTIAKDNLV